MDSEAELDTKLLDILIDAFFWFIPWKHFNEKRTLFLKKNFFPNRTILKFNFAHNVFVS